MAHRHKVHKKASGGGVYYAGGESHVAKEAEEKKRGGAVGHKAEGEKPKPRLDKLKRGGRAMGGRAGADRHPLSSAAKTHKLPGEVAG